MSKNLHISALLAIFLLLMTSTAMGTPIVSPPTPSSETKNLTSGVGGTNTTISKIYTGVTGFSEAFVDAEYQGKPIGWLYINPYSNNSNPNANNMFTVLNSAYWEKLPVSVYIDKGNITAVFALRGNNNVD